MTTPINVLLSMKYYPNDKIVVNLVNVDTVANETMEQTVTRFINLSNVVYMIENYSLQPVFPQPVQPINIPPSIIIPQPVQPINIPLPIIIPQPVQPINIPQPVTKPSDKLIVKPNDKPIIKPSDKPIVKPSDKLIVKPSDKPIIKPNSVVSRMKLSNYKKYKTKTSIGWFLGQYLNKPAPRNIYEDNYAHNGKCETVNGITRLYPIGHSHDPVSNSYFVMIKDCRYRLQPHKTRDDWYVDVYDNKKQSYVEITKEDLYNILCRRNNKN